MPYVTEPEASAKHCPIARISGATPPKAKCQASSCIFWRWKPVLASDATFMSAVKRTEAAIAQQDGKGKAASHYHNKAVQAVTKDPEGHGVVSKRGYCGVAGVPT